MSLCIKGDILKQRVSLDRIVNVRLRIFVKINYLRIAAALEVKYAVVVPAMLVIADQQSLRICGKCMEAMPFSGR